MASFVQMAFKPDEEAVRSLCVKLICKDKVAAEVLHASLLWLDKRSIFERLGAWPGAAEEHGYVRPLISLLREEANRFQSLSARAWCDWIIAELASPNSEERCPCLSGKPFANRHPRLL